MESMKASETGPRAKPGGDGGGIFRFAPSPNGHLHVGHALSALLNADMAKAADGRLLLRIEDIDETRCRPEYETAIYEDLAWLGIEWEQPVRRQSEHYEDYRAALATLDSLGLIYPSFESRAEIARTAAGTDPDGAPLYSGAAKGLSKAERERRIASGEPYTLRLDMKAAAARTGALNWNEMGGGKVATKPELWGDVILARKEIPTSYHLSVVVDDAVQGLTDVVRGRDLFHSTSVHRLLQGLLGLAAPRYHHHRLILDAEGNKLSKSTSATGLRELRTSGVSVAEIRRLVGLD
jgi:glutamyl-Q tRNA(Asp) synthetase